MKNIPRKRDERIPLQSMANGDFVIDIGGSSMITPPQFRDSGVKNGKYPVFDARNGISIGELTADAILRKIL